MPINPTYPQPFRPEDAPFSGGLEALFNGMKFPQDLKKQIYENAVKREEARNAPEMGALTLEHARDINKYFPRSQEAAIAQAEAIAAQKTYLVNLLKRFQQMNSNGQTSGNLPGSPTTNQPANMQSGNANELSPLSQNYDLSNQANQGYSNSDRLGDMLAGMMKIPVTRQVVNGVEISHNPLTGERREKVGPNTYETKLAEKDADKVSNLEDLADEGYKAESQFKSLSEITSDPEFQAMRNSPLAPKIEFEYYRRTGTPSQRELIGRYEALINQLILDSVGIFKKQMTNNDLALLERQKVTDKDSFESAQGKLKAIFSIRQGAARRADRAAEIARSGKTTPHAAMKQAIKDIKSEDIEKEASKLFGEKKTVVKIKNKKTGETRYVSQSEADKIVGEK